MTMIDPALNAAPVYGENGIIRDTPDVADPRAALVTELSQGVREAKAKYAPAFKRMRDDMTFARGLQYPDQKDTDDTRAVVDIIQRHINNRVSALYAKNPTFIAKRRKRMDFVLWDGDAGSLERAAMAMAQSTETGVPPDPQTAALLMDVQNGITQRRMLDRVGKTLEIVMTYSLKEQQPSFKARCKRLVRRTVTTGIGYIKLGYQRAMEPRPDISAELADITPRIAAYERMQADLDDGLTDEASADFETLRLTSEHLQNEPEVVVREGLVIDFPHSTRIIPDPNTTELVGWVGSRWVAEEIPMTPDEIKEVYGVDVGDTYTGYTVRASGASVPTALARSKDKKAMVWVVHHKSHGLVYHIVDGYPDFLAEPAAPPVAVEQFFPFYPLIFNDQEAEDELFPRSDVRLLRSPQREINRKKEGARQHRIASRPRYVGQRGKFESNELKDLASLADHEVLFINGLEAGEKLADVIQAVPTSGVDPNLYETGSDMNDVQLIVGASESSLGNPGGKTTATGDAIAEQARMSSVSSNADDLDDLLTEVAKAAGDILLTEMDEATVKRIAGEGAVWPTLNPQAVAEDIALEIEAGSSGRPNKAQDIANFERLAPTLLQVPGVNADWLARHAVKILDSAVDYEDAITAGLPSIVSQNQTTQPSTGDASTDPAQQGGEGGNNAPQTDESAGGAQPAMPASASGEPSTFAS